MPFLLIVIGLLMVLTAIQDTHKQLGAQLVKDFTGPRSFLVWVLAIMAVGALGYLDSWRTFSRYFLALILIAMVLANRGFFQRFMEQVRDPGWTVPAGSPDARGGSPLSFSTLFGSSGSPFAMPSVSITPGSPVDFLRRMFTAPFNPSGN